MAMAMMRWSCRCGSNKVRWFNFAEPQAQGTTMALFRRSWIFLRELDYRPARSVNLRLKNPTLF